MVKDDHFTQSLLFLKLHLAPLEIKQHGHYMHWLIEIARYIGSLFLCVVIQKRRIEIDMYSSIMGGGATISDSSDWSLVTRHCWVESSFVRAELHLSD